MDLPVSEVVERAKADLKRDFASFTEKRPFTGLVKANPRKALASLSYSARHGDYPQAFWAALIREWPDDANPRLYRVFLHRLGRYRRSSKHGSNACWPPREQAATMPLPS